MWVDLSHGTLTDTPLPHDVVYDPVPRWTASNCATPCGWGWEAFQGQHCKPRMPPPRGPSWGLWLWQAASTFTCPLTPPPVGAVKGPLAPCPSSPLPFPATGSGSTARCSLGGSWGLAQLVSAVPWWSIEGWLLAGTACTGRGCRVNVSLGSL